MQFGYVVIPFANLSYAQREADRIEAEGRYCQAVAVEAPCVDKLWEKAIKEKSHAKQAA